VNVSLCHVAETGGGFVVLLQCLLVFVCQSFAVHGGLSHQAN